MPEINDFMYKMISKVDEIFETFKWGNATTLSFLFLKESILLSFTKL